MTEHAISYLFATFRDLFSDRIYPDKAEDNAPNPCMVYQVIGSSFGDMLAPNIGDDGLLVEIRIYTDGLTGCRKEANRLRDLVRATIQATGRITPEDGVSLDPGHCDSYQDTFEPEINEFGAVMLWYPIVTQRSAPVFTPSPAPDEAETLTSWEGEEDLATVDLEAELTSIES